MPRAVVNDVLGGGGGKRGPRVSEREGASVLPGPDPQASVSLLLACSTASGLPEGGGQGQGVGAAHTLSRPCSRLVLSPHPDARGAGSVFFPPRWTVPM